MTDSTYSLISAESHVVEPADLFSSRLSAGLKCQAPKPATGGTGWEVAEFGTVPLLPTAGTGGGYRHSVRENGEPLTFDSVLPGTTDPAERIKAQESDSVDAEVLYPTSELWDAIKVSDDRDLRLACVRAYNDWIAEFSSHAPDRLIGLAKIPTTSPEDARDEFLRCVNELNLRGAILDAWPSGGAVTDETNDVFWAVANDLEVPVSLHYAVGSEANTAPPRGISAGVKPPLTDAVLPMVTAGVLDRFPNVKLVSAHADAGWALHWLEFMDIQYVRHRHLDFYKLQNPDALPSEYVRKHIWFTFHQDRTVVTHRSKIGTTQLLWSSHFPDEESEWPDNRQQAMRVTSEVDSADQQALLAGNTARLYRLPGYENGFAAEDLGKFETLVHF
jgi:predicted TIM-barrel fold metal-dependent hydrolase